MGFGRRDIVSQEPSLSAKRASLELGDDGIGVLRGGGLATKIASEALALGQSLEDGLLDADGVVGETHVPEHHDGREEEGGGVGLVLASDIGSGAVDGLEDGDLVTHVTRGSETETANETGAHVGEDITVEVGHDEDLVVVGDGVGGHAQAGVVKELGIELDVGVFAGDALGGAKEEAVRELHDGGLVDDADLVAANLLGVLEGEAEDALRGLAGDELNGLDDAVNDLVLDTRVLALGVLSDQDSVDVIVGGLVASDRSAGTEVGKEVEGSSKGQVERDVALANGGLRGREKKMISFLFVLLITLSLCILLLPAFCRLFPAREGDARTARGPLRATLFFSML